MSLHIVFLSCAGWLRAVIQGLFVILDETFWGIPEDHEWENCVMTQQDRQIAVMLKSFTFRQPPGDVWEKIKENADQIRLRNICENRVY